MSEVSTRVWLNEELWQKVRDRAIADGTTVRELIPQLIGQSLREVATKGEPKKTPAVEAPTPTAAQRSSGPPVIELAEVYRCGVCGTDVKMGGLTIHMGKHMKERQAQQ
ncbi:MAG: hypothetical protein HY675_08215, partial [Chloroflexi bacterium]|nr:hypothetical protein [Chloroflexota bacterium]